MMKLEGAPLERLRHRSTTFRRPFSVSDATSPNRTWLPSTFESSRSAAARMGAKLFWLSSLSEGMIRRLRLAEAEASPPVLVEPVSEDPACKARLDLEILLVDRSNGFCGYASNAVAVDKDRHGTPPSCPLLHPARWGRAVT